MACFLLWSSAVKVYDSQANRKVDVTRERISRIYLGSKRNISVIPNWFQKLVTTIYFDLCVDATGVVCHQLGLLGTDFHAAG